MDFICKLCNEQCRDQKDLLKHLIFDHSFSTQQLYEYFNIDTIQKDQQCIVCGTIYELSPYQLRKLRKDPYRLLGCCTSCRTTLQLYVNGSPLSKQEVRNKVEKTNISKYGGKSPMASIDVRNKIKETNMEKYGSASPFGNTEVQEKSKQTNLERYGYENPWQAGAPGRDKCKETNIERYGVANVFSDPEIRQKIKETNLERYGTEYAIQNDAIKAKMKQTNKDRYGVECNLQLPEVKQSIIKRYGVANVFSDPETQQKIKETNLERYGIEYFCQHDKCRNANGHIISAINKDFIERLKLEGIDAEPEFAIGTYSYDIHITNTSTLVEINPTYTHNSTIGTHWHPDSPLPCNYHQQKMQLAHEYGYHVINIFDWDNWDQIIALLKSKQPLSARKCTVKQVDANIAHDFCNQYHLQGRTRSLWYAYGCYYNDELVQVMTFGKPRYNKAYDFELLRLCTKPGYQVQGGANRLYNAFIRGVKPKAVISYCDLSKFSGRVYENLGFNLERLNAPSKHWYNIKTHSHITDNLLRQRGFDQLFNASYGKGTSNEQLMLEHGYLEIYDCGQSTYTWHVE